MSDNQNADTPSNAPQPESSQQSQVNTQAENPQPTQANTPADTLRDTNLKATIWKNEGDKGAYYNTTLSKTYQDHHGNYRDTNTFSQNDLLRVSELARSAYNRVGELRREDHMQSPEQNAQQSAEKQQFIENRQADTPQQTRDR